MDSDILQDVSTSDIPKVLEVLKKDWPRHFLLHQYITVYLELKKKNATLSQALYKYGDEENGVYMLITSFPTPHGEFVNVFVYTANEDIANLTKVLLESKRVPWTNSKLCFEVIFPKFKPCILSVAETLGHKLHYNSCKMMFLPEDIDVEMRNPPQDLSLKYLDLKDIPEINQNWPYKSPGTDTYLSEEVKNIFGLGLYRTEDNKLLSSVLGFHSGGMFVLFTDPDFRKRGYAEIVLRRMVQELRSRGRIPFATVVLNNTASLNLFKKVGFKEFTQIDFLFY